MVPIRLIFLAQPKNDPGPPPNLPESPQMNDAGLVVESTNDSTVVVRLSGDWRLRHGMHTTDEVEAKLAASPRLVTFDTTELGAWDSSAITFLTQLSEVCGARGIEADRSGLPSGIVRLIELAEAVPEKEGARGATTRPSFLHRLGTATIDLWATIQGFLSFLGEATLALLQLLRFRLPFRLSDLSLLVQQCGADALPIVTLISFLVGTILAFVGAVQLEQFGAAIYVADLVGIAMVREMGAMMTGIIMAGRTGAAFAAQLGTMKVTQEIDALTTMGIKPMEFLVLPRMLALIVMMPLLCLYSDLMGILGGFAVGSGMLKLSAATYFQQTFAAVSVTDLVGGVFKASVYGILIALSGCMRGMESGSSASAVGDAATSAVVTGIVFIVVACGLFAFLFNILGI